MESILTSIKKLLGITEDYTHFDDDIIIHINSVFMVLNQIGVGPDECFSIKDKSAKWLYFTSAKHVEAVKTYMYLKVRIVFDPPSNGTLMDALNRQIAEYEWRLNHAGETKPTILDGDGVRY